MVGPQTKLRPTQSPHILCRRLEGRKEAKKGEEGSAEIRTVWVWGLLAGVWDWVQCTEVGPPAEGAGSHLITSLRVT